MAEEAAMGIEMVPRLILPYPASDDDLTTRQLVIPPDHRREPILVRGSMGRFDPTFDFHGLNHPSWFLVVQSGEKSSPFLFNPTTESKIFLPPLPPPAFWNQCVRKHRNFLHLNHQKSNLFLGHGFYMPLIHHAVVSDSNVLANSDSGELEVMVSHGWDSKLFFCRPGHTNWTPVDVSFHDYQQRKCICPDFRSPPLAYRWRFPSYRCMAYCNGRFYAADGKDYLVVCDTRASPPRATALLPLPFVSWEPDSTCFFLLPSSPDGRQAQVDLLLVVKRDFNVFEKEMLHEEKSEDYKEFQVFKLVEEGEHFRWLVVKEIGDQAIFVCRENSFAISTNDGHDSGSSSIISPNCIYYSDVLVNTQTGETVTEVIEISLLDEKPNKSRTEFGGMALWLGRPIWFQP